MSVVFTLVFARENEAQHLYCHLLQHNAPRWVSSLAHCCTLRTAHPLPHTSLAAMFIVLGRSMDFHHAMCISGPTVPSECLSTLSVGLQHSLLTYNTLGCS